MWSPRTLWIRISEAVCEHLCVLHRDLNAWFKDLKTINVASWKCYWFIIIIIILINVYLVTQSCLTLCEPIDCSPPGFSVHGILQARILEWIAISFSRGFSQPRGRTQVSHIAGRCFNLWATSWAWRVKEESEKAGLKLNIQKTKIKASGPITLW